MWMCHRICSIHGLVFIRARQMKPKRKRGAPKSDTIAATLTAWAASLGLDRLTLRNRLGKAGIEIKADEPIIAQHIYAAITGDKEAAMTRKLTAEAEEKERDNRVAAGELLDAAAIEKKLWTDLLQPLRTLMEQQANDCAANCNPQHPEVAKAVLTQWLERAKLTIKKSKS
jgi:hypothetical protein